MQRLLFAIRALAVFSFVLAAGLIGCGSKDETPSGAAAKDHPTKPKKKPSGEKKSLASGTGTPRGRVTLDGPKPDLASLDARQLDLMNKKPEEKQHCIVEAPADEKNQQEWRISDSG